MTFLIVFVLLFLAVWIDPGSQVRGRIRVQTPRLAKAEAVAINSPVMAEPEDEHTYSWAAQQVLNQYEGLPERNRPSYDIGVALRALDVKYGVDEVNYHFLRHNGSYATWECSCKTGCQQSHGDFNWSHKNSQWTETHECDDFCAKPFKECQQHPEYYQMISAMTSIRMALNAQAAREAEREREVELAGIENDLRSVEDITNALRMERDLIDNVTKEI